MAKKFKDFVGHEATFHKTSIGRTPSKCKKEFEPKDELDMFCSQDCKEEALADLDKDSDECLSCQ